MSIECIGMACQDAKCDFKPIRFQRKDVGDYGVLFDLVYCGVCHSDLHTAADHFKALGRPTSYPCVPGHELAGVCVKIGPKVTKFKVGDHIGVGCMVDACLECANCQLGREHQCKKESTGTYNAKNKHGRAAIYPEGGVTMGGYSNKMVVHERFGVLIPHDYPLECAGPVMCSGVTLYEPLRVHKAGKGTRVAVVGMGGLGVMGVKLACELGCMVTAISRGTSKEALARQNGASDYIDSKSASQMNARAGSFDLILSTVPVHHDITPYHSLLDHSKQGKLVLLGLNPSFMAAIFTGSAWAGVVYSGIGGMVATQEVIDLCHRAKIYPEIKVVPVQDLGKVYDHLEKSNDSGIRYVLDIKNTLNNDTFGTCTAPPPQIAPAAKNNMWTILKEALKIQCLGVSRNRFSCTVSAAVVVGAVAWWWCKY